MHFLLALLILVAALGRGGYHPWATLVLELGAAGLLLWIVFDVLRRTSPETRRGLIEQRRAWKKLPRRARRDPNVTILPPGSLVDEAANELDHKSHVLLFGYPFKRTGLGLPILLLSVWLGLSIVPFPSGLLQTISPAAYSFREETAALASGEPAVGAAPWSLAPFLTLRDMWQWLAYLALFYAAFRLSENRESVEKLTFGLFLGGISFGGFGVIQWLLGMQSQVGPGSSIVPVRASGSFGNPNHYAAFLGMLLVCSLGWLAARGTNLSPSSRRSRRVYTQEAKTRLFMGGLGIVVMGLGLIFSLSRSGITFTLAGCVALALLTRQTDNPTESDTFELGGYKKRARSHHAYWALALAVTGFAVWIGIGPVLGRFATLPAQWEAEQSRPQVWKDSLGAVEDFWLTGSGLSSYRYVTASYRSFSGRIFYSWAHNDYLQLFIELGVPGLLLLLWIIAAVGRTAYRKREELATDPAVSCLHAGYCAALVVIALHSFTDFSLHLPVNFALVSAILGVVLGIRPHRREPTKEPRAVWSMSTPSGVRQLSFLLLTKAMGHLLAMRGTVVIMAPPRSQ